MPSDDQVAWDVVRLQVKHGELTRNRICAEHGITPQRLARRIRDHKWGVEPDAGAHDRRIIVGKLMLALEHEIDRIVENRVSDSDGTRETALLGRLTTTLDRLITLEGRVGGKPPTPKQSKEMTELRAKIAKRLDALQVR